MKYLMKKNIKNILKENNTNCSKIAKNVEISQTYISLISNRKLYINKPLAYIIAKTINSNYEIKDIFEIFE